MSLADPHPLHWLRRSSYSYHTNFCRTSFFSGVHNFNMKKSFSISMKEEACVGSLFRLRNFCRRLQFQAPISIARSAEKIDANSFRYIFAQIENKSMVLFLFCVSPMPSSFRCPLRHPLLRWPCHKRMNNSIDIHFFLPGCRRLVYVNAWNLLIRHR